MPLRKKPPSEGNFNLKYEADVGSLPPQATAHENAPASASSLGVDLDDEIPDCPEELQIDLGETYALFLAMMTNTLEDWKQMDKTSLKSAEEELRKALTSKDDKGIKPGSEWSALKKEKARLYQLERKKIWETIALDAATKYRLIPEELIRIYLDAQAIVRDHKLNTFEPIHLQEFNVKLLPLVEQVHLVSGRSHDLLNSKSRRDNLRTHVETVWTILQRKYNPREISEMDQELDEMRRIPTNELSSGEKWQGIAVTLSEIWRKLEAPQKPLFKPLAQFMDALLALFNNSRLKECYLVRSWILTEWAASNAEDRRFLEIAVPLCHLSQLAHSVHDNGPLHWEDRKMHEEIYNERYILWVEQVYDLLQFLDRAAKRDVSLKNFKLFVHRADWRKADYASTIVIRYLSSAKVRSKPQIALGACQGFALALRINGQPLGYEKVDSQVPNPRVVFVNDGVLLALRYQPLDVSAKQNLLFVPLGELLTCPDSADHSLTRVRQCFLLGHGR